MSGGWMHAAAPVPVTASTRARPTIAATLFLLRPRSRAIQRALDGERQHLWRAPVRLEAVAGVSTQCSPPRPCSGEAEADALAEHIALELSNAGHVAPYAERLAVIWRGDFTEYPDRRLAAPFGKTAKVAQLPLARLSGSRDTGVDGHRCSTCRPTRRRCGGTTSWRISPFGWTHTLLTGEYLCVRQPPHCLAVKYPGYAPCLYITVWTDADDQ